MVPIRSVYVIAKSRRSRPMAASWCQGLAGIGTTLLRGACFFDDERLLEAARTAATGCLAVAPRVPLVTQCCGLSGIGELLLDLAIVTNDIRYRRDAIEILNLMLIRSGGTRSAPSFPDASLAANSPGWATGSSGILSFLRRLVDLAGLRLWMSDSKLTKPFLHISTPLRARGKVGTKFEPSIGGGTGSGDRQSRAE